MFATLSGGEQLIVTTILGIFVVMATWDVFITRRKK